MIKLQNDFTTPEQSKRLLELGVPKNSANHYYGKDGKLHYIDGTIPYSLLWETGCTSCWSVGRLIEIVNICNCTDFPIECETWRRVRIVEYMIEHIEHLLKTKCIDFSKLEE